MQCWWDKLNVVQEGFQEVEDLLKQMDKILIWNVRGLNSQQKKKDVNLVINSQKVGLIGLLETKVKAHNMGEIYLNMFKGWCFTSNSSYHRGGRIVLAWNPKNFQVNILMCTSQVIHCLLTPASGLQRLHCTIVYASNDAKEREVLWQDLENIVNGIQIPWVVVGDYNCVLNPHERIGSIVRQQETERLQRAMVNHEWIEYFPIAMTHFLSEGQIDHSPVVIMVYPNLVIGKHPFQKLKHTKQALKKLDAASFPEIQSKDITTYQKMITCQEELQRSPQDAALGSEEYQACMTYRLIHKSYLAFLAQNAKMRWCKDDDENTTLFHQSIKARKLQNTVYAINDMNGH
ncbi:uncharacterized protein LOC125495639 [Beta vulgaris subsp. vulgaris]|uniref:uncharacterized protein LOC125495639 n=1 Tax=Beta vulgaris subsp. vulgaris TaxID=3555 RepID=UPI00203760D6|nr:uncharacterized protein LOC125495639 [Beta vulgaris subsp. vulgaris]